MTVYRMAAQLNQLANWPRHCRCVFVDLPSENGRTALAWANCPVHPRPRGPLYQRSPDSTRPPS